MYKGRVIICDDEVEILRYLSKILSARGLELEVFSTGRALLDRLESRGCEQGDLLLLDVRMPDLDGLEILQRVKRLQLEIPVVIMTAYASINSAIEAMKLGAYDYVTKPFPKEKIFGILEKILERRELLQENSALKDKLGFTDPTSPLLFESENFRQVYELALLVAESDSNAVILGESGTGKELIAGLIHANSPRAQEHFLTINCAALSDTLLESQLFGHVRGAFTGAISQQKGLLDAADKGTLFLDEIGDMSPAIQAKLLRVLQEGDFIPVGDTKPKTADIRFLAATNKDLEEEVRQKRFREDLYFRLNVISLQLPPLRERSQDVELLARHFLKKHAGRMQREIDDFTAEALQLLRAYHWPGNVRELENAIERAVILTRGTVIRGETLPVWRVLQGDAPSQAQRLVSLETVEREHILQVLKATGNNKSRAARILDIARRTLDRKILEFGLDEAGAL